MSPPSRIIKPLFSDGGTTSPKTASLCIGYTVISLGGLFPKRIPVIFAGKAVNGGNAKKAYDILLNSENENKNDSILKRFGIETSYKL